jgi:hypothetical protein
MIKLNKTKLLIIWIMSLILSCWIIVPVVLIQRFHRYKARNRNLYDSTQREKEDQDQYGYYTELGGIRYYYQGSYLECSLVKRKHPYARIGFVIFLNGVLLIYTIRSAKQ